MSRETLQLIPKSGDSSDPPSSTSVVGLVQLGSDRVPGNFDLTLALRAYSAAVPDPSWNTRIDTRLAKHVHVAGMHGSLFIEGLRLVAAPPPFDVSSVDPDLMSDRVWANRVVLGAGRLHDNVDLTSMATVSETGIRDEVELYSLQQAEARFGNGDKMFNAAEQTAAFSAAYVFKALANAPLAQSRRVIIGAQLSF